jgi:hypothetical protein
MLNNNNNETAREQKLKIPKKFKNENFLKHLLPCCFKMAKEPTREENHRNSKKFNV